MNRPRQPFVKEYFTDLANKGNEEATNLMVEYRQMMESEGEFLAGRFLIEVYLEVQETLQEAYYNEQQSVQFGNK